MRHTSGLDVFSGTDEKKSILTRATGKFYTPDFIGSRLAESVARELGDSSRDRIRIIDPFCGDGRLLVHLIRAVASRTNLAKSQLRVVMWDIDPVAVETAFERISSVARDLGLQADLAPACQDSFMIPDKELSTYDAVITNPPWETLKPDRRELAGMPEDVRLEYKAALREYDNSLSVSLPHSQPERKYAGWGTNLSRVGTELAVRLTTELGVCGIVAPLALLMDQMSAPLRKWLFAKATPLEVIHYPAEAKLFQNVDQEVVALTLRKEPSSGFDLNVIKYDRSLNVSAASAIHLSPADLKSIGYCLPIEFGNSLIEMMRKWRELPSLGSFEGSTDSSLWLGRELDETRYKEFVSPHGRYGFIKGRMIGRYRIIETPTEFVREDKRKIPESAIRWRVAWRDVSRRSQSRRMHVALIPPNTVAGNSLHVGYFRDDNLSRLRAVMAIMNSLPFEFQMRSRLGTGHISLGIIRKAKIPSINDRSLVSRLSDGVNKIEDNQPGAEHALETLVARAYDLDKDEYDEILSFFSGLSSEYIDGVRNQWTNGRK